MDSEAIAEFNDYTPDELSDLYKNDREHFDKLAAAVISEACIGKTWQQTVKLRQMQWYIDGQLRKGKTPLQRMQIMEYIFYNRVFGDDGELKKLLQSCNELLDIVSVAPTGKPALQVLKDKDTAAGKNPKFPEPQPV